MVIVLCIAFSCAATLFVSQWRHREAFPIYKTNNTASVVYNANLERDEILTNASSVKSIKPEAIEFKVVVDPKTKRFALIDKNNIFSLREQNNSIIWFRDLNHLIGVNHPQTMRLIENTIWITTDHYPGEKFISVNLESKRIVSQVE